MTIFNPESQISVHRLLRQRLGKVQKALYWRSLPPFTGERSWGLHPEDPGSAPTPTGPAEHLNSRSGHWYSVGEEKGGKCLRKNRSLCTSDIFITHKLGSALTPARGVQALRWKPVQRAGEGGPHPVPPAYGALRPPPASVAQSRHLQGGRHCPQPGSGLGRRWPQTHGAALSPSRQPGHSKAQGL